MLLYFCFWIFLINGIKGGDNDITECNKAVGGFQRPTVEPGLCAHIDLPACAAIFPYQDAPGTILTHRNPYFTFLVYIIAI